MFRKSGRNLPSLDMDALSRSQALIWFSPDGTVTDANDNFCKALGYELNEIVGRHHSMFCGEEIVSSPEYRAFWRDLANGQFQRGQFKRTNKQGQDVWIEASYNPVMKNGKVIGIMKIASDITVTKVAALHDENRLRAIDKSQAIIEFEMDGTVHSANENFCETMGYQLSEIVGRHHRVFCQKDYVESPDYERFWQRLRGGEFISDNFVRVAKGGKLVWIQAAYTPVFNARGDVYKVIKVATDITPRMVAVETIGKAISKLASGDLTTEITEDIDKALVQTKHDFNRAARALETTVDAIIHSSDALAHNAKIIFSVSDEIAKRAETQAVSVEETAAALGQINAAVREATMRAGEARQQVASTRKNAEQSSQIVTEAITAMNGIEASSDQISSIVGVIDHIAFQTNLLALNAGVEAARAGEAGKGFAVVAHEVRELAQRSASAAKEIKELIEQSGIAVASGVDLVNRTGDALKGIVDQVGEIDGNVQAISMGASEQSSSVNEINNAINAVDQSAQQTAATVEEANAASQSLASEADALSQLIRQFKVRRKERPKGADRDLRQAS